MGTPNDYLRFDMTNMVLYNDYNYCMINIIAINFNDNDFEIQSGPKSN